jgi:hypothetical protein
MIFWKEKYFSCDLVQAYEPFGPQRTSSKDDLRIG